MWSALVTLFVVTGTSKGNCCSMISSKCLSRLINIVNRLRNRLLIQLCLQFVPLKQLGN